MDGRKRSNSTGALDREARRPADPRTYFNSAGILDRGARRPPQLPLGPPTRTPRPPPQKQQVIAELKSKALSIQRMKATLSAGKNDTETHLQTVAAMLDPADKQGLSHDTFAWKRYGGYGILAIDRLRQINPNLEDLIVDPVLMSRRHLSDFAEFAQGVSASRQRKKQAPLGAWEMRRQYEATLPRQTWYRGLKLPDTVGQALGAQGIQSRVERVIDSGRRRPYAKLLRPKEDDRLPDLSEAFDKRFDQVIEHRVNKPARGAQRPFPEAKQGKREFLAALPKFKTLSPEKQKEYVNVRGYEGAMWSNYELGYSTRKKAWGTRLEDEGITQSVTRYPEVGLGFGSSGLFGGGPPGPTESVFNYQLSLSTLEVTSPESWVPPTRMSGGVKVGDKRIKNSAALESITTGKLRPAQISGVAAHKTNFPSFAPLD